MPILICKECGQSYERPTKHSMYCTSCIKKRQSLQVMLSRKKKFPDIELGVGSGKAKNNVPGPNNHNWITGIQGYRRLVKKTVCVYCGSTKYLLVHHKDGNRYNNELSNLIIVCKSCHQKHHCKRCPTTGQFLAK